MDPIIGGPCLLPPATKHQLRNQPYHHHPHNQTILPTTRSKRRTIIKCIISKQQQKSRCSQLFYNLFICFLLLLITNPSTILSEKLSSTTQNKLRPPKIKEHPTSLVVKKHDPAKLECKADGNPPPIIEWYKDNQKVETTNDRMILDNSLFILDVNAKKGEGGDTGTYYCLAKNEVGKAKSRNATLEVAFLKDEFRVMPINTKVALGKTITMECVPPKGRPDPVVTWLHDGKPIRIDTNNNQRYKLDGTNLVINDVMQHDDGKYQCLAKNMIGVRESPAAQLKVLVEPYFIRPPESIKTMADSDVVFYCQVGGDPQPKISWRKIEGEIDIAKSQISDDKALRIHQVKPSDEGTYVCEAENPAGKIFKSATLIVNSRPTLVTSPKNIHVMENGVAKMECMATGNPEPIYFWHKESAHLLMFPGQTYGRFNVSNDGVLTISNVAKEDQGFYICSAVSNVGSTIARAYLKVASKDDVPPPIIRFGPSNQTLPLNTKAFLPCEAVSADSGQNVTVEWLYNQIPIHNDSHFVITRYALQIQNIQRTDSGVYTCLASSSSGSTRWNARLLVESPHNPNIKFSKMPHFTMFPEAPSKPIKVNVSEMSITLKWQRTGSSATAPHTGSLIEMYSPDLRNGWTEVARHITSDIFMVKNLQPNTRYIFLVRSQNMHGLGFASEPSDEIRTLDGSSQSNNNEMAISQARNVLNNVNIKLRDARAISSTSIKLFWNVAGNSDFIEGYYIRFQNLKNELSPTKFNMVTVFGGATSSYTVNDLKKYTPYRLFVMPFFRNLEGKSSNIVMERTYEDVPSAPPYSITAKAINTSCAVIEWLPPAEDQQNGIILGYYLQIYENNTFLFTNLTLDASFNSIVLYNLTLGSSFSIQMLAFTAIGNGPLSAPIYLTMDYDIDNEFKMSPQSTHPDFFSRYFWFYLTIFLITIVLFIIAVKLVLIYSKRKNKKSIYEKENSLHENFSDHLTKYDTSNSSKYSSCPDNNEYAEVSDFKHYGENNKAVPYAMTPLIEKSIPDTNTKLTSNPSNNNNGIGAAKFFYHKMNSAVDCNDLANETLLNKHHHQPNNNSSECEMFNMKANYGFQIGPKRIPHNNNVGKYQTNSGININNSNNYHYHHTGTAGIGGGFSDFDSSSNILSTNNYEDDDTNMFESRNFPYSQKPEQNSLPSGRATFNYINDRLNDETNILNSYRKDGRNLMTFHQIAPSHLNHNAPSSINNSPALPPRIISNPLSSFESNSSSDSSSSHNNNNSNKNYKSHYYASKDIAIMPFNNNNNNHLNDHNFNNPNHHQPHHPHNSGTSSSSSSLATKISGKHSTTGSYCDNMNEINQQQLSSSTNSHMMDGIGSSGRRSTTSTTNDIHNQMFKNKIQKKIRKPSITNSVNSNSNTLNNSFD